MAAKISVGGVRVSPALFDFLQTKFPAATISNAYGTSESSGITVNNKIVSGVNVKLLDRPDLSYLSSDKPHPRGEICVCSTTNQVKPESWLCSGDEQAAMLERYLPGGFFKTGDIGVMPQG